MSPIVRDAASKVEGIVCEVLGVLPDDIYSPVRRSINTHARFALFFLLYDRCGIPAIMISRLYGMDHSTVLHSVHRAQALGLDKKFEHHVDKLLKNPLFFSTKSGSSVDKTGDSNVDKSP